MTFQEEWYGWNVHLPTMIRQLLVIIFCSYCRKAWILPPENKFWLWYTNCECCCHPVCSCRKWWCLCIRYLFHQSKDWKFLVCLSPKLRTQLDIVIDLFDDMEADDHLTPSNIQDIETIRFRFMDVIHCHLREEAVCWNMHQIRLSHGTVCPAGCPEELYFLPGDDYVDCKVVFPQRYLVNYLWLVCTLSKCANRDFEAYLEHSCAVKAWNKPSTRQQSLQLYLKLHSSVPSAHNLMW